MSFLTQIVPYELNQDEDSSRDHFRRDYQHLISRLEHSYDGLLLQIFPPEIHSPYPIGVTLNSFYIMKRVTKAISRAITAVVLNYFNDPDLCDSLLLLSDEAKDLLRLAMKNPYEIGSWRPDILYPKGDCDHFRVCEINARFPFNGFYASHEKNNILGQLDYLKGTPLMPVHELDGIPDAFSNFFDRNKSVGVLKFNHVEGWDVKMFKDRAGGTGTTTKRKKPSDDCGVDTYMTAADSLSKKRLRQDDVEYDDVQEGGGPVMPPPPLRSESKSFPQPPLSSREISKALSLEENGVGGGDKPSASCPPSSTSARFVYPNELHTEKGTDGQKGKILFDSFGPLEQFVFECSTAELLRIDKSLIEHILACRHFNDLRTIFLGHDKRMLSVLSSPDIMKKYVSSDDLALLQQFIVPTFVVGVHADVLEEAKRHRGEWVLKPNAGGKGVGIVFGRDCRNDGQWEKILDDPDNKTFVLQRVVQQQLTDILTSTGLREMLVVGLLHCFNSSFLGPGIFRASSLDHPIVNVSGGNGVILSPAVLSCRWNLSRRLAYNSVNTNTSNIIFEIPDDFVFSLCQSDLLPGTSQPMDTCGNDDNGDGKKAGVLFDSIWKVLLEEGIALVHTPFASGINSTALDTVDSSLVDFVHRLECKPHVHSSSVGSVWDVRPLHATVDPSAALSSSSFTDSDEDNDQIRHPRSHTAEAFNMHTDCSFESPPPRFILLYVVQEDRKGGGYSSLIDTEVLMRYLSRKSLTTLVNTSFELKVPPEFYKGEKILLTPLISTAEKLFQYRGDIIVRDNCSPAQLDALEELDRLLNSPTLVLTTLIPTGTLLLLDNMRWFHGRSAILDNDRWLKRIRFNPSAELSEEMPPLHRLVSRTESLVQGSRESDSLFSELESNNTASFS